MTHPERAEKGKRQRQERLATALLTNQLLTHILSKELDTPTCNISAQASWVFLPVSLVKSFAKSPALTF